MAGEKYPTLSYTLVTYVELLDNINNFRRTFQPTDQVLTALNACEAKLKKYFIISSHQSIFYYIALGMYLVLVLAHTANTHIFSPRSSLHGCHICTLAEFVSV